jgi:hypothetical protein
MNYFNFFLYPAGIPKKEIKRRRLEKVKKVKD